MRLPPVNDNVVLKFSLEFNLKSVCQAGDGGYMSMLSTKATASAILTSQSALQIQCGKKPLKRL